MFSRLTFRPPWWATALLLTGCALCIWAGFWQLDRRTQKEALFAAFAAGASVPAVPGPVPDTAAATLRYRPIEVRGHYDSDRQILLDSMVRNGQPGYEVLTPLRTADGTVLVNRGWLPAGPDRTRLPALAVDRTERRVSGRLDRLPRPGLRLGNAPRDLAASWPRRLLFPTAGEIAMQLGYPVHDYQLLLDPALPDGFLRDWQPAVRGPGTNLAYAVQWFAFAVVAMTIYLILNLKRGSRTGHD